MTDPNTKFETVDHTVFGGNRLKVPLLVDIEAGLTEQSQALMQAANIIGAVIGQHEIDVDTMLEDIAVSLTEDSEVVLEDEHGKGSILVTPQETVISVAERGKWNVPTSLMFDMLDAWSKTDTA